MDQQERNERLMTPLEVARELRVGPATVAWWWARHLASEVRATLAGSR